MTFELPALPYDLDALSPVLSRETLEYHYGKHHQAYVNKLNTLIKGTEFKNKTLEKIIHSATGGIFNNAAQIWNHSFYWNCLSPNKNQKPSENLLAAINNAFQSMDAFKETFLNTALNTFGSGWCWLTKDGDNTLCIESTSNANNPLTENKTPLMTCDVWEHAYYIDYRNDRKRYLETLWQMLNWEFISNNFENI